MDDALTPGERRLFAALHQRQVRLILLDMGAFWMRSRPGRLGACYHLAMDEGAGHVDWTGVGPDRSPIEPLNDHTFAVRLRRLSERAQSLTILRGAFAEQHAHGEQLLRHPDPAPRPSR